MEPFSILSKPGDVKGIRLEGSGPMAQGNGKNSAAMEARTFRESLRGLCWEGRRSRRCRAGYLRRRCHKIRNSCAPLRRRACRKKTGHRPPPPCVTHDPVPVPGGGTARGSASAPWAGGGGSAGKMNHGPFQVAHPQVCRSLPCKFEMAPLVLFTGGQGPGSLVKFSGGGFAWLGGGH
jgi:hypothetical protein